MAFDLNQFRNKLANGGARPSQFEMRVTWPTQHVPQGIAAAADLPFLCTTSELPESTIGEIAIPYFGRQVYAAGERTFAPLNIKVINDENFRVRRAIEAWMKAMADHSTTVSQFGGGIASDSYVTDGEVRQYSRNNRGNVLQAYRFVGMFPVKLGAIQLDWGTTDAIESFDVSFRYQWWESIDSTSGQAI